MTSREEVAERLAEALLSQAQAAPRVAEHRCRVGGALKIRLHGLKKSLRLAQLAPLDQRAD